MSWLPFVDNAAVHVPTWLDDYVVLVAADAAVVVVVIVMVIRLDFPLSPLLLSMMTMTNLASLS